MSETDFCPNSDNGNHRYFVFKVVEVFEPVIVDTKYGFSPHNTYFEKVEYAVMGCNCGSSIKSKVKQL